MKNKILVSVVAAALIAGALATQLVSAANLNQAASTLPENDEWSIMAHAAINQNINIGYLRGALSGGSSTDYEKRILAITSVNQNPRTFGNENFVATLLARFDGKQIGDANLNNDDIFGLLALKSAGESGEVLNILRDNILANQNSDGGWSFARGGSSDSNTTAMAISALRTVGSAPSSAVNYLRSTQDENGGFGFTTNESSDGASTAWVILGLRAANASVPSNALSFMDSLQLSNGAFRWKPGDANGSSLVTAYAVLALSGKTLPIRIVSNTPTPTPAPPPSQTPTTQPAPATPNPTPAPIPVPAPIVVTSLIPIAPAPTPQSTPIIAPQSATPPPTAVPVPTPTPVQTPTVLGAQTGFNVSITYPGNKIYVDHLNFTSTSFTASNGQQYSYSDPRAIGTLIHAANQINLLYEIKGMSFGPFVYAINGYPPVGSSGWLYAVNGQLPNVSASDYILKPGDRVQWFYGGPNTLPY